MSTSDQASSGQQAQIPGIVARDEVGSVSDSAHSPFALGLPSTLPPLVAAFEAGRLINRLVFHGVQAPFGAVLGPSHDFHFHALAGLLSVTASRLASEQEQDGLRRGIADAIDTARASYLHPDHPDNLWSAAEDAAINGDREWEIGRFLKPIFESLSVVRLLIEPHLGDERLRRAMRLGERLDQAVAPGQIERRLYDEYGDFNTQLTNVYWQPGEVPSEPGLLEDVRLLRLRKVMPAECPVFSGKTSTWADITFLTLNTCR